ncbi:Putative mycotoxin biosynthesis protein UstYa [Septoria linicola]|uniref:Mycotoxin biosynthesis protein UstYa n=1 Tax=Septoria linicola TaxID=215465 RepID=A0A9Q9AF59_9PEZI|nr:putative mycotoxin biosynthesis protein UstYa [Septoria linicola]USW47975.1 Putative mycotoxin biosynthesis protein UstYa [Septoria linicola]
MSLLTRLRYWSRANNWINRGTEQEEDLLHEKPHNEESNNALRELQASHRRMKHLLIIVTLLLGCVIVAVALPWHRDVETRSPVSEIPSSRVTFQRDEKFAAAASEESDAAWSAMMPPGDGFVVVDDARSFGLPPGKDTRYGEVYDISMWHQLHCLSHMRTYLYTMQTYLNRTNVQQVFDVVLAPQSDHISHCFDYIRQAIMCAGDLTLEWPRTEADGRRFAVDGWGVEHQCKSWDAMADFVERHAVGRHHRHDGQL